MGDPKKTRKKYQTPSHPWQLARIEEEKHLMRDYGLKNKTELWRMHSIARTMAIQAKTLIAERANPQSKKEKDLLLSRVVRYGLISAGDPIESVLALNSKDLLERRLQTQVVRKNLARSMKQARQFITHKHIMVNKKVITSPSYLVSSEEENQLEYAENSAIAGEEHPERPDAQTKQEIEEEKEKIGIKPKEEAQSPKEKEPKNAESKKEKEKAGR